MSASDLERVEAFNLLVAHSLQGIIASQGYSSVYCTKEAAKRALHYALETLKQVDQLMEETHGLQHL